MLTYTIRRLIQAIPIMLGISILIFLIVQLAPGDPVDRFRTPQVRPEQLERLMTPLRARQADPRAVREAGSRRSSSSPGTRRRGATRSTPTSRSAT